MIIVAAFFIALSVPSRTQPNATRAAFAAGEGGGERKRKRKRKEVVGRDNKDDNADSEKDNG